MNYTKKVAYSTVSQMVGKAVGIGISLFTVGALFRYLGVEGVGKYTTVFAFVAFFSVFADFGLQWTFIRELAVNKDTDKVFKNIFTLRLLLAVIIHTLSFLVVWFFNYAPDVKLGVGVITLSWFFTTMNTVFVGVFQSRFRLDLSVMTDVLGRAIILACILFFINNQASLNELLLAYVVGTMVNFIASMLIARKYVKLGFGFDFKYWPVIIRQAFPIGIVMVFGFIYYKIDSLMLSLMKDMVDVGIYGTSYKLLEVLGTVPVMFLGASFPLITKYAVENDKRLPIAFQKQFDFLALIGLPIVVAVYILAKPVIDILGGSSGEFSSASTVYFLGRSATSVTCLRILIFAVGLGFFSNLYSYMIISIGKQKSMVLPTIAFALLNILLNLLLIPPISYLGSSLATLATELVILFSTILIALRYVKIPIHLFNFRKIALCSLLMGAFIYIMYLQSINFYLTALAGFALYVFFVIIFRAVPLDIARALIQRGR